MTRRTVVLPSPYLGPVAYGHLADELEATVASLPHEPLTTAAVLSAFADEVSDADLVVAHSNAGLYAAALGRPTVYLDAALPAATGGRTRLAPPALAAVVAALADDSGVLPPWTRWWPRQELGDVLPDAWFDRVDADAPRVPAAYLTEMLEVPRAWGTLPAAYLAFGDTYAAELALATSLGWPVSRLEGGHLLLLTEPTVVARAVEAFTVS
jgi:hypothetical protein